MAAESAINFANMWQSVLSSVYKLILRNTDKIMDDTSLEKLLDLMGHMNEDTERRKMLLNKTTLMFLNDIQHSRNPVAVGFGLRLSAIISSTPEGFNALSNPEGECFVLSSNNLFCEVLQEENGLWFDAAVVRDSYFNGAIGILGVSEGLLWTQKSGCLEQAMKCLVDSSIFVEANARKFISKYLVALFISNQQERQACRKTSSTGQHLECTKNQHCHRTKNTVGSLKEDDLTCVQCIVGHLQYLIKVPPCGLERKMPVQVSIAQLLLSLAEENPLVAQNIFQENKIFYSCLELLHCANKDECGKVVDVITTFMNNTSKWNINLELLLNSHGEGTLYTLLEFCLVLCQRSLVFLAFQFTQGLFAIPCPCEFKDAWLCCLFTLITFPVHASLHEGIVRNTKVNNCHLKETAKNLLSTIFSKENSYQVMDSALGESTKKFLSSPSISHSLLVTTDIVKDLKKVSDVVHFENFIRNWAADVLGLLTQHSECPQSGNHILRQCIKALTVCISRGFVHNSDGNISPNINKIFSLLLKLSNARSDGQILSGCFEAIKRLLLCVDQSCLTCFLQESVDNVTLGDVLCQHCSHSCWDVKDSVLGFLRHILVTFAGDKHRLFRSFLIKHQLLNLVWTLTEDIESYVRASAIQLVEVISSNTDLWKDFCEAIQSSPEDILRHLLESFPNDEAAFPRRAIITLLAFWMKSGHELASFVLRQRPDLRGPSMFRRATKLEPCVAEVLEKAREDFDWEVKICALNFWEDVMERCDRETREQNGIGGDGEESTGVSKPRAFMDALSWIGFDKVVLGALVDCDKPVRRRGFEMLRSWRERVVEIDELITGHEGGENEIVNLIESIEELEDFLSKIDGENNYTLAKVSPAIDVSRLASAFDSADSLFSDPLTFLKDILLAGTDSEENLLDCY